MAFGLGFAGAAGDGGGVEGGGAAADLADQAAGAEAVEEVGVAADVVVDEGAVLAGQAAGLAGHEHGAVLVEAPVA